MNLNRSWGMGFCVIFVFGLVGVYQAMPIKRALSAMLEGGGAKDGSPAATRTSSGRDFGPRVVQSRASVSSLLGAPLPKACCLLHCPPRNGDELCPQATEVSSLGVDFDAVDNVQVGVLRRGAPQPSVSMPDAVTRTPPRPSGSAQNVFRNYHRQSYPKELLEHVIFDQGPLPSEYLRVRYFTAA